RQCGDAVDAVLQAVGTRVVDAGLAEERNTVVEIVLAGDKQVQTAHVRIDRDRILRLLVVTQVGIGAGGRLAAGLHADAFGNGRATATVADRLHVEGAGGGSQPGAVLRHTRTDRCEVAPRTVGVAVVHTGQPCERRTGEIGGAVAIAGPVLVQ